jgi:hypothetical protein
MYGKLFAQMYDGTLATSGPWQALVTFQQLIILADKHGEVDMTPEAISRRTTIPLDVVTTGLRELLKPDKHSRTPDEDGRRIVPLSDTRDWGWRIVNYGKYRKIRSQDERREYLAAYQREYRARQRVNKNVNTKTAHTQSQPIAVSRKQEAVSSKQQLLGGFDACWDAYPKRAGGNPRASAQRAYAARVREGVPDDELLAGVERYAAYIRATGKERTEYVKQASTFFGVDRHWQEPWDVPVSAGDRRATAVTSMLEEWVNGD